MLVEKGKFEVPYFVYKVEDVSVKARILAALETSPSHESVTSFEVLSKSDWNLNKNPEIFKKNFIDSKEPNYYNILEPYLNKILKDLSVYDKSVTLNVSQGWFNQYTKLNYYFYHWHPGARWAVVYYVELPTNGPKTEFENFFGSPVTPNVQEGNILVFPGWLKHKSPPNLSNNRKTIIAFNVAENKS